MAGQSPRVNRYQPANMLEHSTKLINLSSNYAMNTTSKKLDKSGDLVNLLK